MSYLRSKLQKARINMVDSTKKLEECGVPQGMVCGPLFIIYIDSLRILLMQKLIALQMTLQ